MTTAIASLQNPEVRTINDTFIPYGKTPRLFRNATITEKLDGTNGGIIIGRDGTVQAQSRNRFIVRGRKTDNYGFAGWVEDNATLLAELLGPGRHFGEWWGHGIGRGYGKAPGERFFSLFDTHKFRDAPLGLVEGLGYVPIMWTGTFSTEHVQYAINTLVEEGSIAAPGYMNPEGVITYHSAIGQKFKTLIESDHKAKGQV